MAFLTLDVLHKPDHSAAMTASSTLFQTLRKERHPLAILALLALGLRICTIMLGVALSPEGSAAGFNLLCETSTEQNRSQHRSSHDLAHCVCGSVCSHLGQLAGLAHNVPDVERGYFGRSQAIQPHTGTALTVVEFRTKTPIRAPPTSWKLRPDYQGVETA